MKTNKPGALKTNSHIEKEGWEKIYQKEGEIFSEPAPKVIEATKKFKSKGFKKILDLGCGTGRNAIFLAKGGFSVCATDISKTGVEITAMNAKRLRLKGIQAKVHDMSSIPFPDGSFDAIVCIFAMGHGTLSDAKRTVYEMFRVLKPGGMVVTEFMSTDDPTFGKGEKIEEGTFIGSIEEEKGIAHHYFTKKEIETLFSRFSQVSIKPTIYFSRIHAFDLEATR